MSNNGKPKIEILKVTIQDGSMRVEFGKVNSALLSHAIRMASLHLDNMLIGSEQEDKKIVSAPPNIIDKLRR